MHWYVVVCAAILLEVLYLLTCATRTRRTIRPKPYVKLASGNADENAQQPTKGPSVSKQLLDGPWHARPSTSQVCSQH